MGSVHRRPAKVMNVIWGHRTLSGHAHKNLIQQQSYFSKWARKTLIWVECGTTAPKSIAILAP